MIRECENVCQKNNLLIISDIVLACYALSFILGKNDLVMGRFRIKALFYKEKSISEI